MNWLEILLSPAAWLAALGIFALRVADMTFDTLRVLFVMRGRKAISWGMGFIQSVIFVVAISSVLGNLDNPLNIIGYAAGFATGNVIGMIIEERLAIGHVQAQIVSPRRGVLLANALRQAGFGVTEIPARGKDGMVSMLSVSILRKDTGRIEQLVHETDPEAFVTIEEVRPMRRGFWRG
ncbi:MAG: DUF5698 domain-containing protein [Anaerolineales bacterium]|nr:DUF5698 domain-containing protein [Anaerolineales bacterium]MCX7756651.1 DUF5698 domain-containing protein [Anaerolineales bacterium]MDW8277274.1 DUF5698 domain-containing protein [Anaerolineales bacterium]